MQNGQSTTDSAIDNIERTLTNSDEDSVRAILSTESANLSEEQFLGVMDRVSRYAKADPGTPDIELKLDSEGDLSQIYIDSDGKSGHLGDALVWNSKDNPAAKNDRTQPIAGSSSLEDEDLEADARSLADRLSSRNSDQGASVAAERTGALIRDTALSLPESQRNPFLDRVVFLNQESRRDDRWVPALRITYGDTDGDGNRNDLSDMKLTFPVREQRQDSGGTALTLALDEIDLFDR